MILEHQQEVQEKEFALCLNMIVKNESHIIKETLTKLLQKVKFDYWVISDTGSTDETIEIIDEFFKEVGIPGEIYKDDWVDFAHNRNRALEYAFGKSKYLLVFDADDEIVGDFVLPELTKDYYILHFGSYTRTQIVNNHKRWKYIGVLHECICSDDSTIDVESMGVIIGRYHIKSGRTGNRNLDANKYLKDAIILEKAYNDAVNAKKDIYNRYGFYCANSYYDCGKYESAISWYKKTLENCGWAQEKYVSCLNLYRCYEKLDNKEAGFFYLVKSAEYDRERSECYYELIKYYSGSGLHDVAYGYYSVLQDFYKNSYLKTGLNNKLFIDVNVPDFFLPYYLAIVCEKMRDYETGIHMYRIIFTKKCKIFDEWFIGNLMHNLQFFIEHVKEEDKTAFYSLFQEYVDFLIANNYPMCKHYDLIQKYKKYGIVTYVVSEECSTSTKILIYTGFQNKSWNYTKISSMGGSEKAVAYLAKNLPKEYEIIISGDVEDEVVGNVTYVNRFKLQALLDVEKFHTIIVSRYISFFILFPHFKCYQLYLSAHDNGFLNNFNDISPNCLIEENNKYINGVICLTTWHKLYMIKQQYPCLKDKVKVINNGVVLSSDCDATSLSYNKVKNKFVWTSCSYRGLDVLLKLWDKILEVMPDATLDISSYLPFPNPNKIVIDEEILLIINRHSESVKHHGILNTAEVYNLMSRAEYFLYTCTFCETSCITALEMLVHEVVCLYYPLAGLNDTIGEYGIKVNYGQEIESVMNLSEERKAEMKINGKKYAMSCSWENRAKEWVSVLGLNNRCVTSVEDDSVDDDSVEDDSVEDDDIYNMNEKCIGVGVDKVYLPYKCSSEELSTLHNLNKNTKKEYDFGILKTVGKEVSSRRNKIVDFLKSYNFSINIIEGWNYNDRDFELAKCKIILNIHGNLNNDVSTIFEHIRCDRLLEAGFNILSETCYDLSPEFIEKYPNLKLIEYEEFFDVGIMVDCYNNSFVSNEHNKYVLEMLNNHYNRFDIPFSHVSFIEKLSSEFNPKRMVIYDIGSNVLHWSQHAKVLWKDSSIYAFDAMTEMKLLYDEYNKKNNTTFEYNVGVLCDEDYKRISFYQNDEYSAGNSYYKEIGHCNSHNAYTENHIKHKIGMKLETVVKNKKIPLPDLIKIDVQGAELDILKGSMKVINNAKFLIVELQHVEYNQGAPLCNKTRDFLIENGWEVYAEKFSNNGPDADWCFINKNNHYFELHPSNDDTKNITNLTCITCNEMCDMCDMFQINETLTGVDNITFYYGIDNKHIDITNIVFEKCITDNKIVIPGGDEERGFIFGDPVFGIVKNIYMVVNNCKCCKITYDYYTCIDIFNKKCHISNSINPSALTVYKPPFEKMRLGRNNDGGYVICDIQNINYNLLLSCGISDDISFEEDFCNKYNTTACYAFDGTIENITISNKNISFFKQNINNYNDDKNTNLHSTIEMFDNIFLKMDIEGYEIPWINSLNVKQLNKFSQIVIEFHFPFSYKEVHAFDILNETHILVHFHGNNCCGVRNHKGVNIPNVFECTYVHKRHYSPPYIFNTDVIPGVLDMNNLSNINEIIIDYEPFVFKYNKKNKMIVDCFIFYNELDMLSYRFNILDKVVDYFVLVESTHTHVGKEKPLFYNENKDLFAKFNHKIIHIVVDDFPHKYPNINIEKREQWVNERFQRDCISRGIDKLNLTGEDIIIISDLDEIPNPTVLEKVKNNNIVVGINILDMDLYYYNLNSKMYHKWYHSKILTFEKYKELDIGCDKIRFYNCPIINNGGWHLSYFGNEKFIKNKLENFIHQEFNIAEFTDEKRIEERIKNGKDLFDRGCSIENIRIEDNNNLPPEYDIYLKNYYESDHLSEDGKEEVKINSNKNEMDLNKFNNGKNKFNILNLILFSNKNSSAAPVHSQISTLALQEYYSKMIQLQKEYIKSYSGNNITFYFYCYKEDLEEEYIIEDNMIYIKGTETYIPGILEKTLKVFEITKNMEYDFLLRSNISTIVDYSKLNEILYEIPDNVIYAGGSCLIHNWIDETSGIHKKYNIPFILGTSIILKKEGVNKLIENKILLHETIVDDLAIGIFFSYFGDKPHGFDSYYRYNLHCMTNDVVFYRNRFSYGTEDVDRNIEMINMTNIIKQIMEREHKLNKKETKRNETDLKKFNNGSGIFIQIGSGAGDLDERANCRDGFTELVKKLPRQCIKKIILVEPNPLNIPLLKECWKDYPESIIYEIGIVPKNYQNNTIDLYYCPLDAPHYQVASINKNHVQKHYGDNCEIEKFIIPVKQLEKFINEITTEEIDLLALDIEGIDAEILLDINFNNLKLKYLSFEHLHLGEYKENVLNHLKNNNYEFVGSGVDHNGYDYLYINGHYL